MAVLRILWCYHVIHTHTQKQPCAAVSLGQLFSHKVFSQSLDAVGGPSVSHTNIPVQRQSERNSAAEETEEGSKRHVSVHRIYQKSKARTGQCTCAHFLSHARYGEISVVIFWYVLGLFCYCKLGTTKRGDDVQTKEHLLSQWTVLSRYYSDKFVTVKRCKLLLKYVKNEK